MAKTSGMATQVVSWLMQSWSDLHDTEKWDSQRSGFYDDNDHVDNDDDYHFLYLGHLLR